MEDNLFPPEDGILNQYRVAQCQVDQNVRIDVVDQLDPTEGQQIYLGEGEKVFLDGDAQIRYEGVSGSTQEGAYLRIFRNGSDSRVQIRQESGRRVNSSAVLTAMELEHQIARFGGFLLHAAYICHNGEAILFTAPSETGKSTQAELWCRLRGAELVNGDRAAVMTVGGEILACGVPYAGLSGVRNNRTMPLKAIVRLSQAKKTTISKLSGIAAFRSVWEGCCVNVWDQEDVRSSMDTVIQTVQQIPVYHLACTPDESAVLALENCLNK